MPLPIDYNYSPVIALISSPRLATYGAAFKTTSDDELYGIYVWSQHAASALYPLLQNLEISLRNAVDQVAKERFGEFWWEHIRCAEQTEENNFYRNIEKAKLSLTKNWQKMEKRRRRAGKKAEQVPEWSHDQIIAATDFSTWHFILNNCFSAYHPVDNAYYLWPKSLSKVFRHYASINRDQKKVRKELTDLLFEMREYRNRVFHHEPIWAKAPDVNDAASAIGTIILKIEKLEKLIGAIEPRLLKTMQMAGLFNHARRVCSIKELNIYKNRESMCELTSEQKDVLYSHFMASMARNETLIWQQDNSKFGLHLIN
ncbi:Abi-like protein [Yersinia intermedia]|uniref:Abi-like protein n=1 Tax=Yersinia intermedia TaxID=631 RepID=A0A0H5LXL5_YERIN|nr:Abi family protein [Yersinia intermedia]CRY55632.1 Abi-like protein [Yersinia intermedia]